MKENQQSAFAVVVVSNLSAFHRSVRKFHCDVVIIIIFPLFYTLKLLNALDINSYLEKDVTADSSTWFEGNMICHSRDSPFFFLLLHGRSLY